MADPRARLPAQPYLNRARADETAPPTFGPSAANQYHDLVGVLGVHHWQHDVAPRPGSDEAQFAHPPIQKPVQQWAMHGPPDDGVDRSSALRRLSSHVVALGTIARSPTPVTTATTAAMTRPPSAPMATIWVVD
jgi:hypothetical protein